MYLTHVWMKYYLILYFNWLGWKATLKKKSLFIVNSDILIKKNAHILHLEYQVVQMAILHVLHVKGIIYWGYKQHFDYLWAWLCKNASNILKQIALYTSIILLDS